MSETPAYSDKPWLKSYFSGPFKLPQSMAPYPEMPLFKYLDDTAESKPGRVACVFLDKETTYGELKEKSDRLANALAEMGVKKGDRVATILSNSPQFIIADHAILKAGAVHVPVSVIHKAPEVSYEIKESGADTIICMQGRLEMLDSIREETGLKNIIYTLIPQYPDYGKPEPEEVPAGARLMEDLIEEHEPVPPQVEIDVREDIALLPFTGGTTGIPKATMLTHFGLTTNIIQTLHWMMDPIKRSVVNKASILACVPMFHIYGYWVMHSAISWGLRLLLTDPRDIDTMIELAKEYRPFMVVGVPTHFGQFHKKDAVGKSQVLWFSAAAPLPEETACAFENKTGVPMGEGYGCTEVSGGTHLNISPVSKITGFMAKVKRGIGIPVPDTECKLVDLETGEEVPFGEEGEIWVRGPQVMQGYWPTPGKGIEEDGWLATGDIASMDEDGYFHIVDRVKDMINVSGYKVYTRPVEEVLYQYPLVEMAGVVGIPDPDRPGSERVKAFVMLKPGCEGEVKEEELIDYCRERLPAYAVPKSVEFREELPVTISGKFLKRKLREEEG